MGYHKDLGTSLVAGIHKETGYPLDEWGHLLDPFEEQKEPGKFKIGDILYSLTAPYGHLIYAIGNGDDFYCFDFAVVRKLGEENAPPLFVLHSVINSETGHFIQDGSYQVVPLEQAMEEALNMTADARDWLVHNQVRHTRKGWNQDPFYWARSVALQANKKQTGLTRRELNVTDRMLRYGGKRLHKLLSLPDYVP